MTNWEKWLKGKDIRKLLCHEEVTCDDLFGEVCPAYDIANQKCAAIGEWTENSECLKNWINREEKEESELFGGKTLKARLVCRYCDFVCEECELLYCPERNKMPPNFRFRQIEAYLEQNDE